jgi:hypothetical protein
VYDVDIMTMIGHFAECDLTSNAYYGIILVGKLLAVKKKFPKPDLTKIVAECIQAGVGSWCVREMRPR